MTLAVAVCVALLAVVLLRAEGEMGPPVLPDGTRIANGRPATPRQFPYMAFLKSTDDSGEDSRVCVGSLITRAAVLTEAFCFYGFTQYTVRLGSIYRIGEDNNAWTVDSIWALMHPNYNHNTRQNNIGIVYLPRLAPFNDFIQPVYLPSSPVNSSYIGRQGIVAGWGYTHPDSGMSDVLRWAKVLVIPNAICQNFTTSITVTDRHLCAGSFSGTVYSYDDGVPLVINNRGRYILIGIFSKWTLQVHDTAHPVIYTRVTSYIDWIKLNTESD